MKQIEDHNTLVFIVHKRSNKAQVRNEAEGSGCAAFLQCFVAVPLSASCSQTVSCLQIKMAVKALYDVEVAKINTLIRPDGRKKAYVRLSPDHDAVDVANQV